MLFRSATDIEFGGAVERIDGGAFAGEGGDGFQGFGFGLRAGVGGEPFPATLAAKATFAHAAEAGGRIEEVGGVDPDDAGDELGRDVQA